MKRPLSVLLFSENRVAGSFDKNLCVLCVFAVKDVKEVTANGVLFGG
jgi:hypothetical protein